MEFSDVIRKRRMVRAFTSDPVDPRAAHRILTAANRAPSAGFSQGYALLVLDQPDQLDPFWALNYEDSEDAAWFAPVARAPLVIVPLSCKDMYLDRYARPDKGWTDRDEAHWPAPYWDIDTGFMTMLMLLAAVDEGLGALFLRHRAVGDRPVPSAVPGTRSVRADRRRRDRPPGRGGRPGRVISRDQAAGPG